MRYQNFNVQVFSFCLLDELKYLVELFTNLHNFGHSRMENGRDFSENDTYVFEHIYASHVGRCLMTVVIHHNFYLIHHICREPLHYRYDGFIFRVQLHE